MIRIFRCILVGSLLVASLAMMGCARAKTYSFQDAFTKGRLPTGSVFKTASGLVLTIPPDVVAANIVPPQQSYAVQQVYVLAKDNSWSCMLYSYKKNQGPYEPFLPYRPIATTTASTVLVYPRASVILRLPGAAPGEVRAWRLVGTPGSTARHGDTSPSAYRRVIQMVWAKMRIRGAALPPISAATDPFATVPNEWLSVGLQSSRRSAGVLTAVVRSENDSGATFTAGYLLQRPWVKDAHHKLVAPAPPPPGVKEGFISAGVSPVGFGEAMFKPGARVIATACFKDPGPGAILYYKNPNAFGPWDVDNWVLK